MPPDENGTLDDARARSALAELPENEPEVPTTGGGTVPAAHGGTGTDTGTPGIGPSAGPPGPHEPTADARTRDFDINAGTERATRRD